ncbi:site-specific integrase [Microcoleus sp. Pol10D4]|uniref:site-specific integrase n=1 Tax=Microcoleus sp. Pol10D4 TaxID=3055387 RepID=UPI002FD6EE28
MNIVPSRNRDAIRLQFTIEGVRFSFSPVPGGKWENKRDRQLAAAIANKIENDVLAGNFDSTLQKYRHNALCTQNTGSKVPELRTCKICWLEIWDGFVTSLRLTPATAADHYACVRAMILKANNPVIAKIDWVVARTDLAASTFNRRVSMLRKCVNWAVERKIITKNPLAGIETRSQTLAEEEQAESKKAPFNALEVSRIISYFYNQHPSYAPFVEFLLFSGVRTGEAVGLRWCDIDLDKQTIAIEQSISRERGGYRKIAKRPKTLQSRRLLKMSRRIYDLFLKIKPDSILGKELVFLSPNGCEIDHGNFRGSYWKPTLAFLGITYRKPSATRHTLLSAALESGFSVPQVAALAGHKNSRMVIEHYGRQINQPQLPE